MDVLSQINKQYFRADLPSLQVGDKVEITTKHFSQNEKENKNDPAKPKFRLTHFKGTVIAQKNPKQVSHTFSVLKDAKGSDKLAITSTFSYHSPFIVSIKKTGKILHKVRRAKLYFLERELAEKKDNE